MPQEPEILWQAKRFRVVRLWQRGADNAQHSHEVVLHPGAVVILPLVDDDRICLIRNFRIAVSQTLWELPAGTLEPEEDPAAAAQRELAEETGFRAGRIQKLCEFFMSPGILHERMHLFLASQLQEGEMALEAGEQIERQVMSWPEALELLDTGQIRDAKTLAGILFYDRWRKRNG